MNVERAHFRHGSAAGATAAENRELIAGFIDRAVAIDAFETAKRGAVRVSRGDEFRRGRGLKPEKCAGSSQGDRICSTRRPFLPSATKANAPGGNHADFDVVDVVELAFGGEELIELGCVRFFSTSMIASPCLPAET